jgi:nicotinamidase-related amidase
MRPALLLVDVQLDFLDSQDLQPPREILLRDLAGILARCRERDVPVLHVRTLVAADGHDRMPHWTRSGDRRCVVGSRGAETPVALREGPDEKVYAKQFYSGFGNPALETDLRTAGIDTVLVCGVHTHACVQATVLDAYQRGFRVILIAGAVASYAPLLAQLTLDHLSGRACELLSESDFWTRFEAAVSAIHVPNLAVTRREGSC